MEKLPQFYKVTMSFGSNKSILHQEISSFVINLQSENSTREFKAVTMLVNEESGPPFPAGMLLPMEPSTLPLHVVLTLRHLHVSRKKYEKNKLLHKTKT